MGSPINNSPRQNVSNNNSVEEEILFVGRNNVTKEKKATSSPRDHTKSRSGKIKGLALGVTSRLTLKKKTSKDAEERFWVGTGGRVGKQVTLKQLADPKQISRELALEYLREIKNNLEEAEEKSQRPVLENVYKLIEARTKEPTRYFDSFVYNSVSVPGIGSNDFGSTVGYALDSLKEMEAKLNKGTIEPEIDIKTIDHVVGILDSARKDAQSVPSDKPYSAQAMVAADYLKNAVGEAKSLRERIVSDDRPLAKQDKAISTEFKQPAVKSRRRAETMHSGATAPAPGQASKASRYFNAQEYRKIAYSQLARGYTENGKPVDFSVSQTLDSLKAIDERKESHSPQMREAAVETIGRCISRLKFARAIAGGSLHKYREDAVVEKLQETIEFLSEAIEEAEKLKDRVSRS